MVIHPKNPFVPTVHANWRYFELYNSRANCKTNGLGGTRSHPYYLFEEDARTFTKYAKNL